MTVLFNNSFTRTQASPLLWVVVWAIIFLAGCASTEPEAAAPAEPTRPAEVVMSVKIGSLDLHGRTGRVETAEVEELAELVRREKIDILAVQGVTRYPTLKTRVDPVETFYRITGMRYVIGETIQSTGRQTLNAVFSSYPILSSENLHFAGISGTNFEASVRAIVDAGISGLVIVSTRLPEPLSEKDAEICTASLNTIPEEYGDKPVVVFGNLPAPVTGSGWTLTAGKDRPYWYTQRPDFAEGTESTPVGSPLGEVRIVTINFLAPPPGP